MYALNKTTAQVVSPPASQLWTCTCCRVGVNPIAMPTIIAHAPLSACDNDAEAAALCGPLSSVAAKRVVLAGETVTMTTSGIFSGTILDPDGNFIGWPFDNTNGQITCMIVCNTTDRYCQATATGSGQSVSEASTRCDAQLDIDSPLPPNHPADRRRSAQLCTYRDSVLYPCALPESR